MLRISSRRAARVESCGRRRQLLHERTVRPGTGRRPDRPRSGISRTGPSDDDRWQIARRRVPAGVVGLRCDPRRCLPAGSTRPMGSPAVALRNDPRRSRDGRLRGLSDRCLAAIADSATSAMAGGAQRYNAGRLLRLPVTGLHPSRALLPGSRRTDPARLLPRLDRRCRASYRNSFSSRPRASTKLCGFSSTPRNRSPFF